MPEFGNPFSVLAKERKLTDEELIRAIRFMIAAEYEAVQLYTQLAESTDNKLAIEVLKDHGVEESKIIFINLISCPEGIETFIKYAPKAKLITGFVDKELNSKSYIIPGLGDFGDLYFGT